MSVFLARSGIEPAVFEAYPRSESAGGGFQIAPNGLRVLGEVGVAERVIEAGTPSRDFVFRNHRGKTIGVIRTATAGIAVNIARASLHRILRTEVERVGIPIHYGMRLRGIETRGQKVVATFADGSKEEADLLVGADGIHSRVRGLLLPDHARSRDTRMIALGGFCPRGFVLPVEPAEADRLTFIVGPRHQFGYSKMSGQWGWWCHVAFETDEEKRMLLGMSDEELRARMLERYRGWCAPSDELIRTTESWLRTPIHDVPSLPVWHRGQVVLIGDAAHAMSPAGGQGASLALEDSMLLGKLLADRSRSFEESFARFESLRKKRAEAMVAQGYANDRRSLKELGRFGLWMRDTMLMPMLSRIMAKALGRVYAGDPALRSA